MKLGELFVQLGTKGNTKELEKTLKQLKQAEKETAAQIKLNKDLAKATTDEEKALIKKNYAQKKEIDTTEKAITKNNERNKSLIAGVRGFTAFIGAVSLSIGVLDRFINASAKSNQSIITLAQSSGVSLGTLNKYASAARSVNYGITRESVAQTFSNLASSLRQQQLGQDTGIVGGLSLLAAKGGKPFTSYGMDVPQFIEALRESIKGVSDEWVVEVLSQMGIGPELLPMLRMSKSEFATTQNRFFSEKQMLEEQNLSLELQKQRDELNKTREQMQLQLIPVLNNIYAQLIKLAPSITKLVTSMAPLITSLIPLVGELVPILKTLVDIITPALHILNKLIGWLIAPSKLQQKYIDFRDNSPTIDDVAAWFDTIKEPLKKALTGLAPTPYAMAYAGGYNFNNNSNITINTTQPADTVTANTINDQVNNAYKQLVPFGK